MADDPPENGPANDDPSTPPLNTQIVDAVSTSTAFVFNPTASVALGSNAAGASGSNAGTAIAYQKAAQAAALSVQDAADYQRNIMSISAVAQGKALALMFAEKKTDPYLEILLLAMLAPIAAVVTAAAVDFVAAEVASKFPKS